MADEILNADANPTPEAPEPVIAEQPKRKVKFGGKTFAFPSGTTNEDMSTFFQNFKQTDQFKAMIDQKSGAPAGIRNMVGRHENMDKKLEQLKRYYPDAEVWGEDNFIFTDGSTGKVTLYNPAGLDIGDVASFGREITEGVFATGGAVAGGLSGLATGPGAVVTTPTGAVIGAGLGAEFGARSYDFFMDLFGGVPREYGGFVTNMLESATRIGTAATGEALGPIMAAGAKKAFGGGTDAAKQLYDKFIRLKIDPVASVVTEGSGTGRLQAALEGPTASANDIYTMAENVIDQTGKALDDISSRMGVPREKSAAGAILKENVEAARSRIELDFNKKYTEAFSQIDELSKVSPLEQVDEVLEPYLWDMNNLPAAARPKGQMAELISKYKSISKMADEGVLDFGQLRRFRTQLLEVQRKTSMNTPGDYDSLIDGLVSAMTDDMSRIAREISPDAADLLKETDVAYKAYKQGVDKTFKKIKDFDADAQAFEYILTSANSKGPEGVNALKRLKSNFTEQEWGDVVSSVLFDLGRKTPGMQTGDVAEFSVNTFMTRIAKIKNSGPEAWDTLFSGRHRELGDAMSDLIDIAGRLKEVDQLRNRSQTAGALFNMLSFSALGAGALQAGTTGDVSGIGTAAAAILAPKAAAKLLTSPAFVRWLATPIEETTGGIASHIGRLSAIVSAEPYLQEEVTQYMQALRPVIGQQKEIQQ